MSNGMRLARNPWLLLIIAAGIAVSLAVGIYALSREADSEPAVRRPSSMAGGVDTPSAAVDIHATRDESSVRSSASMATSQPVRPAATDRAWSFETADNLYLLAVQAASSSDKQTLLNAFAAVSLCNEAAAHATSTRHRFNTAPADPIEAERARAVTLAMTRCRGFLDNDLAANLELQSRIIARLRETGSYVAGVSQGPMTKEQLREVIQQQDWMTFEGASSHTRRFVATKLGIKPDSPSGDYATFNMAFSMAPCDLGKECGPNSLTYALHCMGSGLCSGSWERIFRSDLDKGQLAKVDQYRAGIVKAFRGKDLSYFGP